MTPQYFIHRSVFSTCLRFNLDKTDCTCTMAMTIIFFSNFVVTKCELQKRPSGITVSQDSEYERASKKSLAECQEECQNDEKCRAMSHLNAFCFIIYKESVSTKPNAASTYFDKSCNHTYCKYCTQSYFLGIV